MIETLASPFGCSLSGTEIAEPLAAELKTTDKVR